MKALINILFVLGIAVSGCLYYTSPDTTNSMMYMVSVIIISIVGILVNSIFLKKRSKLYGIVLAVSGILVVAAYVILGVHALKIDDLINKVQIAFGFKEVVIVDVTADVYEIPDDFRITFNYQENQMTVYRNEDGREKLYTLSIYKVDDDIAGDVLKNYHGKVEINEANVRALYGVFNHVDEGESIATPYLELDSGVYAIEGNTIIIDDVFTKVFKAENIFTIKLFSIDGTIKNAKDGTESEGVLEEYYTDENYNYIYNGERVYKDLYLCTDYAKLTTPEKMQEYINYLGLQKDKNVDRIIGREIKLEGNDLVSKVRLYYYNNLDSLNFIEIIFRDQADSLIIKESDAKFKYESISKLY